MGASKIFLWFEYGVVANKTLRKCMLHILTKYIIAKVLRRHHLNAIYVDKSWVEKVQSCFVLQYTYNVYI